MGGLPRQRAAAAWQARLCHAEAGAGSIAGGRGRKRARARGTGAPSGEGEAGQVQGGVESEKQGRRRAYREGAREREAHNNTLHTCMAIRGR